MMTIKYTYADGNTITTRINGTIEDARQCFQGKFVNIGTVTDNVQECIKVEEIL